MRLEGVPSGGRNTALNHAAWTLGRWIAAGALEQAEVEDALYVAALSNGLVHDDGERRTWAIGAAQAAQVRPARRRVGRRVPVLTERMAQAPPPSLCRMAARAGVGHG